MTPDFISHHLCQTKSLTSSCCDFQRFLKHFGAPGWKVLWRSILLMIINNEQFYFIIINIQGLLTPRLTQPPFAKTTAYSFVPVSTLTLAVIPKLQKPKRHMRKLTDFPPNRISHLWAPNYPCPLQSLLESCTTLYCARGFCQHPANKGCCRSIGKFTLHASSNLSTM